MAGIGFELKKIYRKDGISRSLMGALYSSIVTIGPTILIIVTIIFLYIYLDISKTGMADREILASTILYIFIFSVILTSPLNAVFSRYLADKIYIGDYDNILSSYYVGAALASVLSMIMAVPMLLSMYFKGGVGLPFILASYVFWASAVIIFFSVTYLHATKDYRMIAFFFLIAMVVAAITAIIIFRFTHWDQVHSILYGLAAGFFFIAVCEFSYIRFYFKGKGDNYTECLKYLWKYRMIFLANLFYILGLYCSNFVFWTTPTRLVVADTFVSHMAYDMASCLAMFTNISTTVIFTVVAETRFHETYQNYMEAVIGGTYNIIQKNKKIMFRTLSQQLTQVFSLQIAITCVIFLLLKIFGESIGFSSLTMSIYPLMAAGYMGVFLMYCNIIYLYYFEDSHGAMLSAFVFLISTGAGAVLATNLIPELYGIGIFIGMIVSWTFSYFRLRYIERNFEAHIFCRHKIIDTMKSSTKGRVVYRRNS